MRRCWRSRLGALIAPLLLGVLPAAGAAAQIDRLEIIPHGRGYDIELEANLDASIEHVLHILADYAHLKRINPEIISTTLSKAPSGNGERVSTWMRSCVWLICRKLLQVEDVTQPEASLISARIVPGAGDFASGSSLWRLTSDGGTTHVHYEATREPAFWIPPGIGRAALSHKLREQFKDSMAALEHLANEP